MAVRDKASTVMGFVRTGASEGVALRAALLRAPLALRSLCDQALRIADACNAPFKPEF